MHQPDPRTQVRPGDVVTTSFTNQRYEVVGFLHRLHSLHGIVVLRPLWADERVWYW